MVKRNARGQVVRVHAYSPDAMWMRHGTDKRERPIPGTGYEIRPAKKAKKGKVKPVGPTIRKAAVVQAETAQAAFQATRAEVTRVVEAWKAERERIARAQRTW